MNVLFWGGFALCGCVAWFFAGIEWGHRRAENRRVAKLVERRRIRRVMAGVSRN